MRGGISAGMQSEEHLYKQPYEQCAARHDGRLYDRLSFHKFTLLLIHIRLFSLNRPYKMNIIIKIGAQTKMTS